ncbi:AsmA-like C-terminal region-containing protein [Lewinella sp. 4G2]|uniref:AsmA-like C-terminal region-containing protein n=1 Tax=Lewinella sp. 4G2 TaxID=1803372 RepID=UPI0007B4839F|nr:AsmA-like C-terminal region-containing protein [Lewinella sp. 4G2]OAV43928.1 hypothetical protein A3850_005220 [Lewinella sp. 4G2]
MRALKIFAVILLLLVLVPVLVLTLFGGPIARSVVGAVNERMQTEIRTETYDVSFWSTFPNLSVGMRKVQVAGSDGSELLAADRIDFLLDLGSLFGKIRVEEVVISGGQLQVLIDVDGNSNYQLAGYTVQGAYTEIPDTPEEPTEFAIREAIFQDMAVLYRDEQLGIDLKGHIDGITFSGDFAAEQYLLATEGSLFVDYLDQEGERYVYHQQLDFGAKTTVNNAEQRYTLAPLQVSVGKLDLSVVGDLIYTTEGMQTDLRLESGSGSLADVIALVPPAYAGSLRELETRGELALSATVTGNWSPTAYPRIEGKLNFTDGRVGSPRVNLGARDLNLRATFTYLEGPRGGVQSFAIDELTGKFRSQPFSLQLLVEDVDNPRIDLRADGAFALETLPAFLGEAAISDGDGFLRLDGFAISGLYDDMLRPRRMGNVRAGGRVTFEDGELTVNGRDLSFPSGSLELRNNEMELTDLAFSGPGTELRFTGRATNLIPVLFADSLNSNDAQLLFDARLIGETLDLDRLLSLAGPSETEETEAAQLGTTEDLVARSTEQRTRVSALLNGKFDARIEEWNYEEIEGKDFIGQLVFQPGKMNVAGVTEAMGGKLELDGAADLTKNGQLTGRIAGTEVDVKEFFTQGENFAQDVLTADNLSGTMDTRIWVEAAFDEAGEFDFDALKVKAGLSIRDGELVDFEMLENFAFALKSGDLERVRFTKLENYFEIVDQTLYLPAMFIQSSALNMEISGSHSFDQQLEYYTKVNAGQAIANKIARHDEELEVLPQRRGWFNLYYTIKGPLEDFRVERDKRGVKRAFERSLYRRNRVKTFLNEQFGDAGDPLVEFEPLEGEE